MAGKPYLIVSDIHAHIWSAFSTTGPSGVNSRLDIILDELQRAAKELKSRGGDTMFIAGDLFHVRGAIAPEVFNPTFRTIERILLSGVKIIAIPGNHDLSDKDTTEIGNAFQSMGALDGFTVVTEPELFGVGTHYVLMVPWQKNKEQLRAVITDQITRHGDISKFDLILHVGIDGMLDGVPASGLTPAEVASWGFGRVFAGDYHNHRVAELGKVISIGATTHQTWSDIGAKAGFLLVDDDSVEYCASHAPSFVEIDGDTAEHEIPLIVDGNYVRVRGIKLTDAEIKSFRQSLEEMGARGVTFQVAREVVGARTSSAVAKAATLDESVGKFIDGMKIEEPALAELVKTSAAEILTTVRSIAA